MVYICEEIWYNKVEKSRKRGKTGMRSCKVTITTTVDNQKTKIVRNGRIDTHSTSIRLAYAEEHAEVLLTCGEGEVEIERRGDYTMRLRLKKGETREGSIGIGGNEGGVRTRTSRVYYAATEGVFTLVLHYDLIVGKETQRMRVRIDAEIE